MILVFNLEKARPTKYKKRWKGPDGKWQYTYDDPKPKKVLPPKRTAGRPGSQLPPEVLTRLRELGVGKLPAADVPLSEIKWDTEGPDVHRRFVISWRDSKQRCQHGYTPKFHERNAKEKWARVEQFRRGAPALVKRIMRDIETEEPGSTRHQGLVVAAVVGLTGLRPGAEKSASYGHHGVSTLRSEHISIQGNVARFEFVGKGAKINTARLQNKVVVDALQHYADQGGRLFSPKSLRAAREELPAGMKLKDFRTIKAVDTAMSALKAVTKPPPLTGDRKKDKRSLLKAINAASKQVADALNNTPAVARGSYVPPEVFRQWAMETVGADPSLWEKQ